jgi:hypothetical protein
LLRGFAIFRILRTSFALAHSIDDRIAVGPERGRRFLVILKDETDLKERSGARSSAPIHTDGVY